MATDVSVKMEPEPSTSETEISAMADGRCRPESTTETDIEPNRRYVLRNRAVNINLQDNGEDTDESWESDCDDSKPGLHDPSVETAGLIDARERRTCLYCQRQFKYRSSLMWHERTHTGDRSFECEKCGKRFIQSAHLKKHLAFHRRQAEPQLPVVLQCKYCLEVRDRRDMMEKHVKAAHAKIHPNKCGDCPCSFKHMQQLRRHIKANHKGVPSKRVPLNRYCDICKQQFTQRSNYINHVSAVHHKSVQFDCPLCPAKFSTKGHMKRHTDSTHCKRNPHRCLLCVATFARAVNLRRHVARDHDRVEKHGKAVTSQVKTSQDLSRRSTQRKSRRFSGSTKPCDVVEHTLQAAEVDLPAGTPQQNTEAMLDTSIVCVKVISERPTRRISEQSDLVDFPSSEDIAPQTSMTTVSNTVTVDAISRETDQSWMQCGGSDEEMEEEDEIITVPSRRISLITSSNVARRASYYPVLSQAQSAVSVSCELKGVKVKGKCRANVEIQETAAVRLTVRL